MKQIDDDTARELSLRFAAAALCLWRLCGSLGCRRARACRGNVRLCAGRVGDWFEAVTNTRKERLCFEEMEERLEGSHLAAFRRWKAAVRRFGLPR